MRRRDRMDTRYNRALGIGLFVSLAAHAGALAFGVIELPARGGDERTAAPRVETEPRAAERALELVDLRAVTGETRTASAEGSAPSTAAELRPVAIERPSPTAVRFEDYAVVLARATSTRLSPPLVPFPAMSPDRPATVLTPTRVPEGSGQIARAEPGQGRGPGIRIFVGDGGHCPQPGVGRPPIGLWGRP